MRFAVVVVSPVGYEHSAAFAEVAESYDAGLRALGHDSKLGRIATAADTIPLIHAKRRLIVFGANLLPRDSALPLDSIIVQLEQIDGHSPWLPSLAPFLQKFEVWDYSPRNAERYASLGLPPPAKIVPIGYVPSLTRIEKAAPLLDVVFFGSWNERRAAVIADLQHRGVRAVFAPPLYGSGRDRILAQSRIALNVHFYPTNVFEIVRVSYLLANRICVVSEDGGGDDEAPFRDGVAFTTYAHLADRCVDLLGNPAKRERIEAAGFQAITARPMEAFLRAALGDPVAS